ncbi:MAG: hypothetical protein WA584_23285 [Pyrinomonadaceae bacterium]
MFDKEFWGEPIYTYTDEDALEDGTLLDFTFFGVKFNGLVINRATANAGLALEVQEGNENIVKNHLQFIAENCRKDRKGADAWGIFEPDARHGNVNLWLVPNETGGCTLMLPEDY